MERDRRIRKEMQLRKARRKRREDVEEMKREMEER